MSAQRILTLYLIRHGQTAHNISAEAVTEDSLAKQHNPPLTETGIRQAVALGEYYSGTAFDYIYSSGLQRAIQTACCLRDGQKEKKPIYIKPDLAEILIPDEYKGEQFELLCREYDNICMAEGYDAEGPTVISDGKATEKDIFERAGRILDWFLSRYSDGETVAVVAHAAILTYMLYHLLGFRDHCPALDFDISNTGVTEITFYKKGTFRDDIVIEYVNSTIHLPKELNLKRER